MSKPLTPRRRFGLRVVGEPRTHTRHAAVVDLGDFRFVAECWSFDEWDRLMDWERPPMARCLPGHGYIVVRSPMGDREVADLLDLERQEADRLAALMG